MLWIWHWASAFTRHQWAIDHRARHHPHRVSDHRVPMWWNRFTRRFLEIHVLVLGVFHLRIRRLYNSHPTRNITILRRGSVMIIELWGLVVIWIDALVMTHWSHMIAPFAIQRGVAVVHQSASGCWRWVAEFVEDYGASLRVSPKSTLQSWIQSLFLKHWKATVKRYLSHLLFDKRSSTQSDFLYCSDGQDVYFLV